MGKKREEIIKKMGKKNPKWPKNVKEAYDNVFKINNIINGYVKRVKGYEEKLKQVVERFATLDKAMNFLNEYKEITIDASHQARDWVSRAGLNEILSEIEILQMFREFYVPNVGFTIAEAIKWATDEMPGWFEWYAQTKREVGETGRSWTVRRLYDEFVRQEQEWSKGEKTENAASDGKAGK